MKLLEVRDLRVAFPTADGVVRAVRGVSFSVEAGRTLGIVGESGSGKSVSTQTLMGLTPGAQVSGEAWFDGQDLLAMPERQMRRVRGAQIGMIFQDPLSSLHPHYKVGWQIVEMIREHEPDTGKAAARKRAVEMLGLVGIPQPDRRVDDYPHQFSGGMRQRAMIAMALALHPKLIIADEPTTALDATVQMQILDLMRRLQREFDTALIMITHDLGVIADMADDVLVMYGGREAEVAGRRTLYYRPHHPYTVGLLESVPSAPGVGGRLKPIPGQPPSLINLPSGCVFHPRCEYVMERCRVDEPPLREVVATEPAPGEEPAGALPGGDLPRVDLRRDGTHRSACWLPHTAVGLDAGVAAARRAASEAADAGAGAAEDADGAEPEGGER
ncbi:ABC transporter ATP-binding protein [Actinomadura macrotermitis]|uniref:Oligopeptide transport ATP-binding protein OppD n=1 Tax=Actinomadura macrotermitis TaxID=2585200 RepID=A0A7K0C5Q3_9ACTN|nr:ABC transporter ATP-binding protein [Actinomadura macrotermitis]MQY08666.1 Oligopeptide transport ATP-binding protein OppD [Actinomadura macrotermitis]